MTKQEVKDKLTRAGYTIRRFFGARETYDFAEIEVGKFIHVVNFLPDGQYEVVLRLSTLLVVRAVSGQYELAQKDAVEQMTKQLAEFNLTLEMLK